MKAAIIGASKESLHTIEKAREQGIFTIALDGNPEAAGLAKADVGLVIDISDEKAVIEALEKEKPDFVLPVPIGRYLTTIGAVNEALGLPGLKKRTAEICTDKYLFHQVLRDRKLRPCHCYLVNRANLAFPMDVKYPAILKPRFGSGSKSIHYLENEEQLQKTIIELFHLEEDFYKRSKVKSMGTSGSKPEQKTNEGGSGRAFVETAFAKGEPVKVSSFLSGNLTKEDPSEEKRTSESCVQEFKKQLKDHMENQKKVSTEQPEKEEDYVLEEVLPGEEYGVDAAVVGCNFELVLLRRKLNTPLPERQAVGYLSVQPEYEPRIAGLVQEYMSAVVQAMGLKDCILHADLVIRGKQVSAIEVSARPSGHNLHDLFTPLATGIDLCESYMSYLAGEAHNFTPFQTKKMMIHFFDMENQFVHGIPNPEAMKLPERVSLLKWNCNLKMLDYLGKVTDGHSLMGRGFYILEGPDDRRLLEAADSIRAQFELM